jgi:hypothetical protein
MVAVLGAIAIARGTPLTTTTGVARTSSDQFAQGGRGCHAIDMNRFGKVKMSESHQFRRCAAIESLEVPPKCATSSFGAELSSVWAGDPW